MPFGLTSAGAVYSRFVPQVLDEEVAPEDVDAYLDDVVVSTQEEEQHLGQLREVLQRNIETGIKLFPTKTLLFEQEVEFLGHRVSMVLWNGQFQRTSRIFDVQLVFSTTTEPLSRISRSWQLL